MCTAFRKSEGISRHIKFHPWPCAIWGQDRRLLPLETADPDSARASRSLVQLLQPSKSILKPFKGLPTLLPVFVGSTVYWLSRGCTMLSEGLRRMRVGCLTWGSSSGGSSYDGSAVGTMLIVPTDLPPQGISPPPAPWMAGTPLALPSKSLGSWDASGWTGLRWCAWLTESILMFSVHKASFLHPL